MRRRKTTITEEYGPIFRRRMPTNFLNLSMPNFDEEEDPSQDETIISKSRCLIPPQSPLRKSKDCGAMNRTNQNYQNFLFSHEKIHKIIDEIDSIIRNRMEAHQLQLIQVVRKEIDAITQDSRKVVQSYNQMIEEKNKETQIYSLQNQLAYFQFEAKRLFQDNKKLKNENKELRALLKTKDSIIQEVNSALRKSTKKYLKQRYMTENNEQSPQKEKNNKKIYNQLQNISKMQSNGQKTTKNFIKQMSMDNKDKTIQKSGNDQREIKTRKKNHPSICLVNMTQTPQIDKILKKSTNQLGSFTHRYKKYQENKQNMSNCDKKLRTLSNLSQMQDKFFKFEDDDQRVRQDNTQQFGKIVKKPKNKSKSVWKFQPLAT